MRSVPWRVLRAKAGVHDLFHLQRGETFVFKCHVLSKVRTWLIFRCCGFVVLELLPWFIFDPIGKLHMRLM